MFVKSSYPRNFLLTGLTSILVACGGGGGGGGGGGSGFLPFGSAVQPQPAPAEPVKSYVVGGSISGLTGTLTLQNNAGDELKLSEDGTFAFATPIGADGTYDVKIQTQPLWQFCAVTKGAGTVKADVVDVGVTCTTAVGEVTTFAGTGMQGSTDGPANSSAFVVPAGIALGSDGGLLVADAGVSLIRRISPTGDVSTIAGNATIATVDGNGIGASFEQLFGITKTASGDTFVVQCAQNNHLVRKMSVAGDVSTFAGSGNSVETDGNGAAAEFSCPQAIASDDAGNLYVADASGNAIRKINQTGDVTTLAGSGAPGSVDAKGTAASFNNPVGIAVDKKGNVFVSDLSNHKIRRISPSGDVTTLAGTGQVGIADGGPGVATLTAPVGIAVDGEGNLFVMDQADGQTGNALLRRITSAGVVTTVAGQAVASGTGAEDGVGSAAAFSTLVIGLAVGSDGGVFVADGFNHKIRRVMPVAP